VAASCRRRQTLRIVDLEGNQAVDFLLYSAADDAERYSAQDTVSAQGNLFLRTGTVLRSNEGRPMMTIVATSSIITTRSAARARANPTRCAMAITQVAACLRREFSRSELLESRGKRDMVSNINFFMNVPVEEDGALGIVDGISAPGLTVDLRAEMAVIVVVSNCRKSTTLQCFNPRPFG